MTRYLIIDDEYIAHDIIKGYCDMLPTMQLMKNCYDALDALDYLQENIVDLIFLDLSMPKLKGFDFLKTLVHPPKVIVTTAYKEYALEGYELEIIDYLLKPFSFERFLKAVNKTIEIKEATNAIPPTLDTSKKDHIFFYSDKKHIQVKIKDMLYVEAAGNYSKIVQKNSTLLVREKISNIVATLSSSQFVRVHKSFIVSTSHIQSIQGNRLLINGSYIPIGNLYKTTIKNLIER
ncbi:LytR/AlgR family response regulator transcription factor [Aquimarina sp. W85]|uniref:LytR/AlgR family response regulator transcription factor n=1 Tax=Aquimarina rhodophyticola TaxID=3342246 RepID=UPI00367019DA